MKKYCFVLLCFSCFIETLGQQSSGVIYYREEIRSWGLSEEYKLFFNKNESEYIHLQKGKSFESPQGYTITIGFDMYEWYLDAKSKSVTERRHLKDGNKIVASFVAQPIKWEIQNETKKILGFTVQKAIAKVHPYSGREGIDVGEAIAWFAPDLPNSTGPERFWGLPGIILHIEFSDYVGELKAEKIIFEPVGNIKPSQGIQVSKEELENPSKRNKKWLKKASDLLNNDN
ncbi:MAG: GLPGLI family protein [Cyclobacteriaceae bacterium]|nr:GLPGLI family protein [Cyclobacteriaceae bacterium]